MQPIRVRTICVALLLVSLGIGGRPVPAAAAAARVAPGVSEALAAGEGRAPVWVRFTDKDLAADRRPAALVRAAEGLAARARARRARGTLGTTAVDAGDLPLSPAYLDAVRATGADLRHRSRWLNAASFLVTAEQVAAIAALPFVAGIDPVAAGVGRRPVPAAVTAVEKSAGAAEDLGYGPSGPGLAMHGIPELHDRGLTGRGVTVAVFDTGFDLDHECFQDLDVVATRNFIQGGSWVGELPIDDPAQLTYGTAALSVLAGSSPGQLVGAAPGAAVLLAKTENLASETPAEEDAWIAALEWAEALGADVVCSGLGYYSWYRFDQLDGRTAAITVAAEMAAARGVCVVNAVGDMRISAEWPHILPPSDGRSVIAVGAVDENALVTWFSAPGPTADGRIKPDVMAFGSGHPVAIAGRQDLYNPAYGSNYAVPLVAGAVALLLEVAPTLGPVQILEALRTTASRARLPDNDYGWGAFSAVAALDACVPVIRHTPLADEEGGTGPHRVRAVISDRLGLDPDRLAVTWRAAGGPWGIVPLVPVAGDTFAADIPPQSRVGTQVEYYLTAANSTGRFVSEPAGAPDRVHTFRVGADTTPPVVGHVALPDQVKADWPPLLWATASDNMEVDRVEVICGVPGLGSVGPFPLQDVGDHYELPFPVDAASVFPGFTINYTLVAWDTAATPNVATSPVYSFRVVASRGRVLVVDDRNATKSTSEARGSVGPTPVTALGAADLAGWLTDAGFTADVIAAAAVQPSVFDGYDAVVVSCGGNFGPLAMPDLRRTMAAWEAAGGRLVLEGGETAYAVAEDPGYPDLLGRVVPISAYGGEAGNDLYVAGALAGHPLSLRPHRLPGRLQIDNSNGGDFSAADLAREAPDASTLFGTVFGTDWGGVIMRDDNTCPDAGQLVYLPFDLMKCAPAEGRALLDNVVTWLVGDEPPGGAGIAGRVTLGGNSDHGGVTVRVGRDHAAVTAADGTYEVPGLWGGTYTMTVEAPGFAPATRRVVVVDDELRAGTDFLLVPAVAVSYAAAPAAPIPDNDPSGVVSAVVVVEPGAVENLSVDIDVSHFAIGQLVVTLTAPDGNEVTLHNRTGGTADNLVGNWPATLLIDGPGTLADLTGRPAAGTWTLRVTDRQLGALGTLQGWSLNLLVRTADIVASVPESVPTRLHGAVPNPFNPRTTITYDLVRTGPVALAVYDVRGRRVRTLVSGSVAAGRHDAVWDGRDDAGGAVASGVYFARLSTAGAQSTQKMLLVR